MIRDEQEPTSVNKVRHIISINKKSTINWFAYFSGRLGEDH